MKWNKLATSVVLGLTLLILGISYLNPSKALAQPQIKSTTEIAQLTTTPNDCPEGWVPAPNPALGCIPDNTTDGGQNQPTVLADLRVREFQFIPANPKAVEVVVANTGAANSGASILRLTVRQINDIAVSRMTEVMVPAIAGSGTASVVVNANDTLPVAVALQATTFRLDVDATEVVNESNEANNLTWHNL